jgi:CRP-like cAMP-binding protein
MIHTPIDDLEFKVGDALYGEGSAAMGVFTLRTGMLKLVRATSHGRLRIVRVLRPGDVAGLEALATSRYDSEAIALTNVSVCRIPLDVIHTLGSNSRRMHDRLMQKWQHALKDADDWLADLNFGSARQRVANLVLKMRNLTDVETCTLFSREDMGSMMDLKFETVSRELSKLVRAGALESMDGSGRTYFIRNMTLLQEACACED